MNEDESFQRASAAALRLLSYRPRSEAEIRTRLRPRFQARVVEQVIASLTEQRLVDDPKFARLWKDSRDSHSPRSAWAIKRELISKGVSRDVAEEAVCGADDEDSAYRAGAKPARRLEGADFTAFRRKLWGYLRRRGFSDSVTRHAIARLWDEQSEGRVDPAENGGSP